MTASTKFKQLVCDFVGASNADKFANTGTGTTRDGSTANGASLILSTSPGDGRFDFGDNLTFNVDDVISVQFLAKIQNWNDDALAYLGLSSAGAADFNTIANHSLFVIGDGAAPPSAGNWEIFLHADDTVNDVSLNSSFTIASDVWTRFYLNLSTGVQTQTPPLSSTGGKSNIQWHVTDDNLGYQQTLGQPATILSLQNYTGGLQPVFGVQQAAGAMTSAALIVREVCLEFKQVH